MAVIIPIMNIFVAATYSSMVNNETKEVFSEYKTWLENTLKTIEASGHKVFCALQQDGYKLNDSDQAVAFNLDRKHLEQSDVLVALLTNSPSTEVQTEIGIAIALRKQVILAHLPDCGLAYFNNALIQANVAQEIILPITITNLKEKLQ